MANNSILPCVFLNNEDFLQPKVSESQIAVDPDDMAMRIKELGRSMGAADVKIGPLNPNWLYKNQGQNKNDTWGAPITLAHKHAISMAYDQRLEYMLSGDGPSPNAELLWVYSVMANAAIVMANVIAQLGYSARAHTVRNYHLLQVPVALDAGMGELGRVGYVVHPTLGTNFRLITISTDLPMTYDKPIDFGLQEFCENCKLCAEACPSGAVTKGGKEIATSGLHTYGGIKKWFIEPVKCLKYWGTNGTDCAICHTACPWSKKGNMVHGIGRSVAATGGTAAGSVLSSLEKTFYGNYKGADNPDWLK